MAEPLPSSLRLQTPALGLASPSLSAASESKIEQKPGKHQYKELKMLIFQSVT